MHCSPGADHNNRRMTSADVAIQSPDKPLKRPDNAIRRKLRAALDAMIWDGLEWNDAAHAVGFNIGAMRKALNRPHVIAYLRAEREVFRASISPKNIHRLKQIRDAADNMPAVNAIKVLEQISDEQTNVGVTHSPHLTIRIVNVQPAPDFVNQKDVSSTVTIPHDPDAEGRGEK